MKRLLLAVALLGFAAPSAAQSLLSESGFGYPLVGIDARSRALGSVGVGLGGPSISPTDPAAAADVIATSVVFSGLTSWVDVSTPDGDSDFTTSRFPLLGVSYPIEGVGVASVTFSSLLDASWENTTSSVIDVAGGGEAQIRDIFESQGGVAALEFGFAKRFGRIAAGARVGRYTGSARRTLTRVYDSVTVGAPIVPFQTGGRWDYSGFTGIAGVSASIGSSIFVSGSLRIGGTLEATPSEDTSSPGGDLSLPAELRAGGSILLAPELVATLGASFADWSGTDETGQTAWEFGGGVEWTGSRIVGKEGAWRLGLRRAALPFRPAGADSAVETAFTGGLGIEVLQSEAGVLGSIDLAFEFGQREFGAVQEDLLRSTLTVRLAGF